MFANKVYQDTQLSNNFLRQENLPFSNLQIAYFSPGEKKSLMIKNDPSSRKLRTVDLRSKHVLLFEAINERKMLIKLQDTIGTYWTIMDVLGNICEIPEEIQQLLNKE